MKSSREYMHRALVTLGYIQNCTQYLCFGSILLYRLWPIFHLLPFAANNCTATQVTNSNKAGSGSINGTTSAVVIVTCNAGYTGGGNTTCGTGGTFNNLTCSANTCTCPSGTATVATGTGGTLCEANNTVDCSACNPGFNLSSSAGLGMQSCIGELCCFVLVHIYYDSCDHIVLL